MKENHGIKEGIDLLVKEYGKRNVKKAVLEIFRGWEADGKSKKIKEFERIAADLYEKYPGDGIRHLTIRNIVRLFKKGVEADILSLAVERYRAKLKMERKAGKDVQFEFLYHSHNFFGEKAYWRAFLTEEEMS